MTREILGIHHITAIAGDPQQNIEFYTGLAAAKAWLSKWRTASPD